MYGQYKRIRGVYEGVLTGKGLSYGGSLVRTQATGYGLLYLTQEMLKLNGIELAGKTVAVSGSGNVAIYATEKAQELGAKVVTVSDSTGWVYDPEGIDLAALKEIKEMKRARLTEYKNYRPNSEYHEGRGVWTVKSGYCASVCDTERTASRGCKSIGCKRMYCRCRGLQICRLQWKPRNICRQTACCSHREKLPMPAVLPLPHWRCPRTANV